MPVAPYPISGTIYDRNGSTALLSATVVIFDVTTQERISTTTNASGQFIEDLANLTSGYSNGDKIQISAFYGTRSARRSLSKRHTVDTVTGSYTAGSFVLHAGDEPFGDCHIVFASHTNSSAGGLYVDFYNRDDDFPVFRIEAAAGTTNSLPIGYIGEFMEGGYIRVFESATSGDSEVLTVVK